MRKMKKLAALILAGAMVLGMSTTALAADVPSTSDKAAVTVSNVKEDGVSVKAYEIVHANYNDNGFLGYSWVAECGFAADKAVFVKSGDDMVLNLTDTELAILAGKTDELGADAELTDKGTYFESEKLNAGTYMIIVTGDVDTVYNPMIVSVYYDVNGVLTTEPVYAETAWDLATTNAYVKSSKIKIDKNIVVDGSDVKGDDADYNDTISFKLDDMTIPSYSAQYKNVEYNIIDTLSNGLSFVENDNLVVKVGGETITAGTTTYTKSIDGQVMTISFASDFIKANALKKVEVTYDAKLNTNASLDEIGNTNKAKVEFTNDPKTNDKGETEEVVTYHYTFDFQIEKYNEDKTVKLEGAEFTLYEEDGTTVIATQTTDGNGLLTFAGLDEGTYKFVETKAPTGYQLDDTVHTVAIVTDYNDDGTLKTYTITIDDNKDLVIESYVNGGTSEEGPVEITNTQMINLPSTGGIGTTIFTIGGVAIILAAAALLFARRRVAR